MWRHFNFKKYPKVSENNIIDTFEKLQFKSVDVSAHTSDEFFSNLEKIFCNVGVRLFRFSSSDSYEFGRSIHWLGIGEKFTDDYVKVNKAIKELLSNESLLQDENYKEVADGFIGYSYELGENIDKVEIREVSSYCLDGELTSRAYRGGAYTDHFKPVKILKKQSRKFVDDIIENRFDDFKVYSISGAWTDWFAAIAWDYTYFMFDELKGEFWLLAMSDTD